MFKLHGRGHSLSCLECDKPYERPRGKCLDCKAALFDTHAKRCPGCARKASRISNRPSYDVLKKDLTIMSYVACGKKYSVSDNSIRNWLKEYERMPVKMPVFKV